MPVLPPKGPRHGPLSEGAVSEADWGSPRVIPQLSVKSLFFA